MPQAKIPPHSDEAENSVLGAVLIDKNAIVEVAGFLRPEHFYNDKNGQIFEAMLELYEERKPIDILTLTEKLRSKKNFKEIGGTSYLADLTNSVPTSANVENYGAIIRETYSKRELITAAGNVSEMSFDSAANLRDILDRAESQIFSISQDSMERNFVHMRDILAQSFDRLEEIQKTGENGGLRGVATGFRELDNVLTGLQPSNLVILAARPGIGKTAFALNIARNVAVKDKQPVGIFSLEMSQEELGDRLLVMQSDVDAFKFKTGRLDDTDLDLLQDSMGVLADAPIYIDDTPGISIMEMRTKARRLQMEHGLKLLIIDYLQLIDPGRKFESRAQEVSVISQSLKNIARELRIPVICLSQLNRAVESRGTKKPQLADLRESGSIEQDADVVMFIYRPDEDKDAAPSDKIMTKLSIDKHRNGSLREFDMMFVGNKMQFKMLERKREEEG